MYVTDLSIREFRCIASADVDFLHPDIPRAERLEMPNVNLLTGLNGGGKSTVLKAIVAAALGSVLEYRQFSPAGWVRRDGKDDCYLRVGTLRHASDGPAEKRIGYGQRVDFATRIPRDEKALVVLEHSEASAALVQGIDTGVFLAAYGPTRQASSLDFSEPEQESGALKLGMEGLTATGKSPYLDRVASILNERSLLQPLESWLPDVQNTDRERFTEICKLLGSTIPPVTQFEGKMEGDAYLFVHDGVAVPYGALSEGLRSHISWIADLLYHLNDATPAGTSLDSMPGVVLVDEIDQRLHPRWQLDILSWLSAAFPVLQFIVTSHSPLLAGGLRPPNIAVLEPDQDSDGIGASRVRTVADDVFGRSADGVLTSSYFDLASTRADPFRKHLRELVRMTRSGDEDAPLQLMRVLGDPQKMQSIEDSKKGRKKRKKSAGKRKTKKKSGKKAKKKPKKKTGARKKGRRSKR